MIAYTGETPWHGLGFRVKPGTTPEEMARTAKLDWQVEMRSLAVSAENAEGTRYWEHRSMKDFKAVVRADTGHVFAVPTKRYQPVQNMEICTFFNDWCDSAKAQLVTVGALDGGAKVWALARINADYDIGKEENGVHVDRQVGYVMLATSHDGSLRTIATPTAIYVVCWNTMSAALSEAFDQKGKKIRNDVFALSHRSRFTDDQKRAAAETVGLAREQMQATAEMARAFSAVSLDDRGRVEFVRRLLGGESVLEQIANDQHAAATGGLLDAIVAAEDKRLPEETRLGKNLIDAIVNSPGSDLNTRKDTLWGAVNGVTWYTDYKRGRTQESTLDASWFGQGATLKAKAVQVAYDMKGARA
jgi:phage/plasmid-like protein (TIGR03299 family)